MTENSGLEPQLAEPDDPWRCDYCGESYRFSTHPFCLKKALEERDEAREVLRGVGLSLWGLANGTQEDYCRRRATKWSEDIQRWLEKRGAP